ncbi:hypothetical protein AT246_07505 [Bartonella henselae]|nr:hypothetical protein AT247_05875 [Bartonella henselae]OLL51410.1 hypothetical protein AT241_00040 [Bartonella henselae]OLL53539.1 hypothetical protein AT240_02650 [Bartonella henselae]OLL57279.1 hypothetical protein AT246_07505 [Bartonella henselae]
MPVFLRQNVLKGSLFQWAGFQWAYYYYIVPFVRMEIKQPIEARNNLFDRGKCLNEKCCLSIRGDVIVLAVWDGGYFFPLFSYLVKE